MLHLFDHVQNLYAHIFGKIELSLEIINMRIHLFPINDLAPFFPQSQGLLHIVNTRLHVETD
jgi:hypothetical protein